MASAEELRRFKEQHTDAAVVTYVNSTAEVKAESDICCTSSNAEKIVRSNPVEQEIIFVPDQNLGQYVKDRTGRDIILWPGFCIVHHLLVTPMDIAERKADYPDALVLVHPECTPEVTELADFVGSTSQILTYCRTSEEKRFIIGTETGIIYPLKKQNPDKEFIPASENMVCRNMKKITLDKVIACMENRSGKIEIASDIHEKALAPIKRMLEVS
jgi:quinolinate synthase